MKQSILWRIMEIEVGVIRRGRTEISIILHMIRKPNSIIVLLFIQNNSSFNMPTSIDVKFIFDSACLGLFSQPKQLNLVPRSSRLTVP